MPGAETPYLPDLIRLRSAHARAFGLLPLARFATHYDKTDKSFFTMIFFFGTVLATQSMSI
jgi:hypothetical protein